MKQQSFNSDFQKLTRENGYVVIAGAFFLVALTAILGLAIDGSRAYHTKLRIQRAVDAGAVAGSKLIATDNSDNALGLAQEFSHDSLSFMGYNRNASEVNAIYLDPPGNTEIEVIGSITIPNYFLSMLPGFPDTTRVRARGVATTKRSVICIILDTSGSMSGFTNSGKSKIEDARNAIVSFFNLFEENLDYIGVVRFSNNATELVPISDEFKQYEDEVLAVTEGGLTNTEDSLKECREQILSVPSNILASANKSIILMTDGAPTKSCSNEADFMIRDCNETPDSENPGKKHYDRALRLADSIRNLPGLGIAVHSIGIGRYMGAGGLSAEELERRDAYQKFNNNPLPPVNEDPVKTNFLRRVANVPSPTGLEPENYFEGGDTFSTPTQAEYQASHPTAARGVYVATSNAGDLEEILLGIGRGMKGRLIN
jgi:hypothetical protein